MKQKVLYFHQTTPLILKLRYLRYYEPFLNICRLVKTQNGFEFHHLQNDLYCKNNLNQTLEVSIFYLFLLSILLFLLMLQGLCFNQKIFTRLEILDWSTNLFSFIFASSICLVNLVYSEFVKYIFSMSNIFTS